MHESNVIISNQIIVHVPYCFLRKHVNHVNHAHQELINYNWFENFHLLEKNNYLNIKEVVQALDFT
jgi:hypothetical protein